MYNGSIVKTIIIVAFTLFGTYAYVQTNPFYTFACLVIGVIIAMLFIPMVVIPLGLGNWWLHEYRFDELGSAL
jgi:hypothetical protein